MKKQVLGWLLLAVPSVWAAADHNALLPRPQEVRYSAGSLALNGLSIRFASAPSAEDRFAAQHLSSGLSALGQTLVPIQETGASGPAIVLERTGDVAALPTNDERPGPDS